MLIYVIVIPHYSDSVQDAWCEFFNSREEAQRYVDHTEHHCGEIIIN